MAKAFSIILDDDEEDLLNRLLKRRKYTVFFRDLLWADAEREGHATPNREVLKDWRQQEKGRS